MPLDDLIDNDALAALSPEEREQLERQIVARVERIERDLLRALHRSTRNDLPRLARWFSVHTLVDLAGRIMLTIIAEEGATARPRLAELVDRFALLIAPGAGGEAKH